MTKKQILVGAHVSTAKALHLAFDRGESIGCTAIQIFSKGSRCWKGAPLQEQEISLFKKCAQQSPIKSVIVHAGYLINIGSTNPDTEQKSIDSLVDEVTRCAQLGIPYLVLHPGSHLKAGEQAGIERIARNLQSVLEKTPNTVSILLETAAGQGTNLGYTFEQLLHIRNLCKDKERIMFCLDTCHIFAAGYNLDSVEHYQKVMCEFDKILGLKNLKAIHINDSMGVTGSHIDRHAPLGTGKIPLAIFKAIMQDARLVKIPKILETPTDEAMELWKKEIALLKDFSRNTGSDL